MQTLAEIRALLESRGFAPRKSFGQNFLIDQNLLRKLADSAEIGPGSLVLEVGPGTGTLTEELLDRGAEVIACELDRGLCELLRERLGANERFTLIEGDCLAKKSQLSTEVASTIGDRKFSLVANLPYSAATPLIMTLLVDHPNCERMCVTIQREVAERLAAAHGSKAYGSKAYGPISVVAQSCAQVRIVANLPPSCFWPRPEVNSAMVRIDRLGHPLCGDLQGLALLSKRLFSSRRKQLGSVLGRNFPFPDGVDPGARVESLTPAQIVGLLQARVS
ncbi:MAG: ribosomal RNA small subunit methyltransferase A [Phycisphaerales bacterium]|nr:ribosomal RNA small subunit methyltransferase A [Phycisphaerales bacterium]